MNEIYQHKVAENKLDSKFKLLSESPLFDPAKTIIANICALMTDGDGNFLKDFQSTGFDSRLWEIYLFIFLVENEFEIVNEENRPDFHVRKNGYEFFIEASLSAEKENELYSEEFIKQSVENNDLEIQNLLTNYYSIRLGSVLFSKLNKKYWELPWVQDKPLIIAITPAHNYMAKFLPDAKIMEYLYGIKIVTQETEDGLEHIRDEVVEEHKFGDKVIPSNFFTHPDTENISAIIFTNNCDLHKFNRMGYEHSLTDEDIIMVRSGYKYDDSKDNAKAKDFAYQVKKGHSTEDWNESLTIYHNPNAKIPLDRKAFINVRQMWVNDEGQFEGIMMKNFVYHSITASSKLG